MTDDPTSLSKLHDIVMPEPVSWWPMASAWWILLGGILLIAAVFGIRALRSWRANAYRRAALVALTQAESPEQVAAILRRAALAIAPRESVAALHDEAWIDWLSERSPVPVPETVRPALTRSLYAVPSSASLEELRDFASRWIRQHTRPC